MKKAILLSVLIIFVLESSGQSRFFFQYWANFDGNVNNNTYINERTRVNDPEMSTHQRFYSRYETQANGLLLVQMPDTVRNIERAEVYLEMWGGHAGTAAKSFRINGANMYNLPSEATNQGHCEYLFCTVPVSKKDLVRGTNAIQFTCERGETFWGHYIVDNLSINVYLKNDSPEFKVIGLSDFNAKIKCKSKILADDAYFELDFPEKFRNMIDEVHYFAKYTGFDGNGFGVDDCWHGFQFKRKFTGHLGTTSEYPFQIKWDTRMVPDQGKTMAVKALIRFKNNLFFWSDVLQGLSFSKDRPSVQLFRCEDLPKPFWSRDNRLKVAFLELPEELSDIESAELHVRIWDGGEGDVKEPFKLNGFSYPISTLTAPHDFVYTINQVIPEHLKVGDNRFELISGTEHHGIEICLPGPCLIVRYKK